MIKLPWAKVFFGCTILFIIIETIFEHLRANSMASFWLDESLMFYVANHPPFSNSFFGAMRDMMSAMPWPFVEYWAYEQILKHSMPLNHLMENLEFYLRLPLTFYSIIVSVSIFLMTRILSGSYVLAGFITVFLGTINPTLSHLGSEVRFHTSGLAHTAISWCLLAHLLTAGNKSRLVNYILFFSWVISVIIAGASHVYALYSLFLQVIVLVFADHDYFPNFSVRKIHGLCKSISILVVYGIGIVSGLFFVFVMVHSGERGPTDIPFVDALKKGVRLLGKNIFLPGFWIWLILYFLIAWLAIRRIEGRGNKIKILFGALFGLSQLALIVFLSMQYLRIGYGPESWMGRYVIAGLIPFIFFLAYLAKGALDQKWESGLCVPAAIFIFLYFLINPEVNDGFWPKYSNKAENMNKWNMIRHEILKNNAYGKVNYVLGLNPDIVQHTQHDVNGGGADITWQLYTGGPFSITTKDKRNLYGGRTGIPCEIRDKLPPAILPAKEYAVDFCEKDKAILRIVKFN